MMFKRNLVLTILLTILMAGCKEALGILIFKLSLSASKGKETRITLNWNEDSYTEEDEEEIYADSYIIYRNTSNDYYSSVTLESGIESTDYNDRNILNGRIYYYWVESVFDGQIETRTSADWGYALQSEALKVYSTAGTYFHQIDTTSLIPSEKWFNFEAQQGWTYQVVTLQNIEGGGLADLDTSLELYYSHIRPVDLITSSGTSGYGEIIWTCQKSGTYYLKVIELTGVEFSLYSWHQ